MSQDFLQKFAQFSTQTDKNYWVMTLSMPKFDFTHLAHLHQIFATLSPTTSIAYQTTLTSELNWLENTPLTAAEKTSPVTNFIWLLTGELPQDFAKKIIANLRDKVNNPPVDINIIPLTTYLRPHKLALFDMDSTLIEQEVIVELAKKAGIGEQVNAITESAMRGEIDFSESFTRRVGLLKGLSKEVLDEIIRDNITFSLGAKRLITALKHNGYHVVLVSGGFTYFAEFVQKQLGINEIYANDLDIVDGKVTGQITSPIVDGKRKADILQMVAKRLNVELNETVAVGDGANDLPMLKLADIGVAYHAKPIVQAQADYAINVAGLDGIMPILGLN